MHSQSISTDKIHVIKRLFYFTWDSKSQTKILINFDLEVGEYRDLSSVYKIRYYA